mmetsp:Transcript_121610/g.305832  ORF Transcript_121610/g.305832 Transcript_121610/m.305832 type:complete len:277 (+) Transcript_121610:135-965(+)
MAMMHAATASDALALALDMSLPLRARIGIVERYLLGACSDFDDLHAALLRQLNGLPPSPFHRLPQLPGCVELKELTGLQQPVLTRQGRTVVEALGEPQEEPHAEPQVENFPTVVHFQIDTSDAADLEQCYAALDVVGHMASTPHTRAQPKPPTDIADAQSRGLHRSLSPLPHPVSPKSPEDMGRPFAILMPSDALTGHSYEVPIADMKVIPDDRYAEIHEDSPELLGEMLEVFKAIEVSPRKATGIKSMTHLPTSAASVQRRDAQVNGRRSACLHG